PQQPPNEVVVLLDHRTDARVNFVARVGPGEEPDLHHHACQTTPPSKTRSSVPTGDPIVQSVPKPATGRTGNFHGTWSRSHHPRHGLMSRVVASFLAP